MATMSAPLHTHTQATPYDSPWTRREQLGMLLWEWTWTLLCAWTPKPLNSWRLFVLRGWGARLHGRPFVHQRARVQIPWKLIMHDRACLGDRTNVYSLGEIENRRGGNRRARSLPVRWHARFCRSGVAAANRADSRGRGCVYRRTRHRPAGRVGRCACGDRRGLAGHARRAAGHDCGGESLSRTAAPKTCSCHMTTPTDPVPVSIMVPIKNEAANLERCLRSVAWADEVFVVDSQSTDGSMRNGRAIWARRWSQFAFNGTWPKKEKLGARKPAVP